MPETTDTAPDEELSPELLALVRLIREETEKLSATLPDALERQWSPSPVPKPSEDTSQRSTGGRPKDPTADAVLDGRRLALRSTVVRSERLLRETAIRLRATRLGVEKAVARYDGEEVR